LVNDLQIVEFVEDMSLANPGATGAFGLRWVGVPLRLMASMRWPRPQRISVIAVWLALRNRAGC